MSLRMIASFVLALVFGVIAVVLVRGYLSSPKVSQAGQPKTVPVVVASQPIARGVPIVAPLLKVAAYPEALAPAGAFQTVAQVIAAAHTALHPIGVNEPVLALALSGAGGAAHLSADLKPGMRAVSFRATDVAG